MEGRVIGHSGRPLPEAKVRLRFRFDAGYARRFSANEADQSWTMRRLLNTLSKQAIMISC